MSKIDLKKEMKPLYSVPKNKIVTVDVPKQSYLMISGNGDPNQSPRFQSAVQTLYPVAYKIKFLIRETRGIDYGVMPLEGIWGVDPGETFSMKDRRNWKWTIMILQPDFITPSEVEEGIRRASGKKDLSLLSELRYESVQEGLCAQILHLGPFSEEPATIEKLHQFIDENGYRKIKNYHREIYLTDFNKTAPENLKTIIRQPIGKNN